MVSAFTESSLTGSVQRLPDPDLCPSGQGSGLQSVGRAGASGRGTAMVTSDVDQPDPGDALVPPVADYRHTVS